MSKVVVLKYDPSWDALKWAKEHCKSYITNVARSPIQDRDYKVAYYFSHGHDALIFKLRWGHQVA